MKFEGLLTGAQHCAGYFTTMDEDFVYLWHRRNGNPDCVAVFLYNDVKVKQVREAVETHTKMEIRDGTEVTPT